MNIREISKPVTSASLNESLAKKFGQKIKIDSFTLEQLQDARNKIRTRLSQVETLESFDSVQTETYQKSKLFLDVLNAAISEREDIAESKGCPCNEVAGKPCTCPPTCKDCDCKTNESKVKEKKQIDRNGDGKNDWEDVKLARKAAAAKAKKKNESIVKEGAEDEAELVMAAKDMVDRVTGWMEDTAEMQTESMLELADAIRDEMGSEKAEAFTASVKPALEAMYTAMESTRITLTQGVGMLTGEGEAPMMGAPDDMGDMPAMEPTIDGDMGMDAEMQDEFAAADPAAGGEEEAGRAKRESVERRVYSKKKVAETSRKLGTLLSKKKS